MLTYPRLILVAVLAVLLVGLGWFLRGFPARADLAALQSQRDADAKVVSYGVAKAASDALAKQGLLEQANVRVDALQKGVNDAKADNDDLRGRLGAGTQRVLVRATCPAAPSAGMPVATAAPGVDTAAGRAELDHAVAERLFGIAGDGDEAIRQLGALQEYVSAVVQGNAATMSAP